MSGILVCWIALALLPGSSVPLCLATFLPCAGTGESGFVGSRFCFALGAAGWWGRGPSPTKVTGGQAGLGRELPSQQPRVPRKLGELGGPGAREWHHVFGWHMLIAEHRAALLGQRKVKILKAFKLFSFGALFVELCRVARPTCKAAGRM